MNNKRALAALLIILLVALYLGCLVLAGVNNRYQTNPDGVAYIRLGSYWASWRTDLMVSGCWGPLLSWIIAPLVKYVSNPFYAGRIAVGVSAILYSYAGYRVMRQSLTGFYPVLLGTSLVAAATVGWSVTQTTPDLLLSGLLSLGFTCLLTPAWVESPARQAAAGGLFGAAYLAKGVAFPTFWTVIAIVAVSTIWRAPANRRRMLLALLPTIGAFLIVAMPWLLVLSFKYGRPVVSTSAPIVHAVMRTKKLEYSHPWVQQFAMPDEGRVTQWEEPSKMPYQYWSPFSSAANLRFQLLRIAKNVARFTVTMSSFDFFHVGMLLLVAALLWHKSLDPLNDPYARAACAIAAMVAPYLPLYADETRYFYCTFPFLLAANVGWATELWRNSGRARRTNKVVAALVVLSFALVSAPAVYVECILKRDPAAPSWVALAQKVETHGLHGPIAANTKAALYMATLTNQPVLGCVPNATVQDFETSGASLVVVQRNSPVAAALSNRGGFENGDAVMFASDAEAGRFPLQLFRKR
ncbi:MAG: hypothetical protein LLG00_11685 [Planctomycetaceae bacterium]|nr:hypothetical protein [Planctomycetaceae bacterium]